ncbi:MAG: cytochrome c biogenesis protein CcsA [Candidatus Cryptobacteroides sp.]
MKLRLLFRNPVLASLHAGILLILVGALLTWLSGDSGRLHLRVGESASAYTDDDGAQKALPFIVRLVDFRVDYYPGTRTPGNYVSTVEVDGEKSEIWLNHILRKKGYRFYQSAYDDDGLGSVLLVSHDPWGTAVVYAGYLLVVLSMIGFFFSKRTRWAAIRKLGAAAVMLVAGVNLSGAEPGIVGRQPKTVPVEVAEKMSRLSVEYNGRIAPMQTMMQDYVLKVYGRKSLPGYTTEQIFAGWMFWYDSWGDVPVKKRDEADAKGKKALIESVASGLALKMFPLPEEDGSIRWYSPSEHLPADMDPQEWLFIRKVMTLVRTYCIEGEYDKACETLDKVGKWQKEKVPEAIPSEGKVAAERVYNAIGLPRVPAILSIIVGLIAFLAGIFGFGGKLDRIWIIYAGICFLYLLLLIGLRWGISGHLPMTSGFEMMLLIACLSFGITVVSGWRKPFFLPLGILLGGFAMLVSSMGQSNPQIGSLMPVLSSPLLCLHVSAMMVSYTLFGLVALNSLTGLLKRGEALVCADRSALLLYPALFTLVAGTILGSVWANISWGSYWTWDPKETWSIITIIVYALPLHARSLRIFSRPTVFNIYCFLAFASVLFTYFGVNYLLGGLHSYA